MRINTGQGLLAERLFDSAHGFDEFAPIHSGQEMEAVNAVADGKLIGCLLLILRLDQLLDGQTGLGELLLDPRQRQGKGRTLSLQAPRQFRNEGADHGRLRAGHIGDDQDEILRDFARPFR